MLRFETNLNSTLYINLKIKLYYIHEQYYYKTTDIKFSRS